MKLKINMKSIDNFITEAKKNTVSFEYDESPEWNNYTCGVDYGLEPVIIIGEPASRTQQDKWDNAYKLALGMGMKNSSSSGIPKVLEMAFGDIEDEIGIELDEQQCVCLCYIPSHSTFAVYTYGPDGVEAIK